VPRRAASPCRYPGCIEIVRGVPYCEAHAREVSRRYEAGRPSAAARGYNGTWRKLRAMVLARRPLCEDPMGRHGGEPVVAAEVHHLIPLNRGGTNDMGNLQALCKPCHGAITARTRGWGQGRGSRISSGCESETAAVAMNTRAQVRGGGGS